MNCLSDHSFWQGRPAGYIGNLRTARALAVSSSRLLGGALVTSESSRFLETASAEKLNEYVRLPVA